VIGNHKLPPVPAGGVAGAARGAERRRGKSPAAHQLWEGLAEGSEPMKTPKGGSPAGEGGGCARHGPTGSILDRVEPAG